MPSARFRASGTETDLEKQLPLCNEGKEPSCLFPWSPGWYLMETEWKIKKLKKKRGGWVRKNRPFRDGTNTQGWCMGRWDVPLLHSPLLFQVVSCSLEEP